MSSAPADVDLHHTIDSDEDVEPESGGESSDGEHSSGEEGGMRKGNEAKSSTEGHRSSDRRPVKVKATRAFLFDFDDGQFQRAHDGTDGSCDSGESYPRDSDGDSDSPEAEEEGAVQAKERTKMQQKPDTIRPMPHSEQRLARAAAKANARSSKQQSKKSNRGAGEEDGMEGSEGEGEEEDDDESEDDEEDLAERALDNFFESTIDAASGSGRDAARRGALAAAAKGSAQGSAEGSAQGQGLLFTQLGLSRPLLRAVERAGYVCASPIQAQVLPVALAGRDVCASAETGSGKTAAFLLPSLERLLYRPRDVACTRVLVVTPTRELALQIHEVLQALAQFTDVTSCLVCGGKKDLRSQEVELRQRPDVVVCTPGRLLDHLRNSASVRLDQLDVLVLDEADRLLELGFQDEVEQLLEHCAATASSRQTMLFSATMTARVEDLARLSLKRPVRVRTTHGLASMSFAPRLVQEFVKVRAAAGAAAEQEVEATLLALVLRGFGRQTIVFFEQKKQAHRFCALLQLLSREQEGQQMQPQIEGGKEGSALPQSQSQSQVVRAAELHGDIPQAQRYAALQRFRSGQVHVLVATDVAARGLDIPGVQTVLNADMPRTPSIYVHRVGRTARAGCGGRSITLVSAARRKVLKDVLKGRHSPAGAGADSDAVATALQAQQGQVLSRTVPAAVLAHYSELVRQLEPKLGEHFRAEREQAKLDRLVMRADRAENMLLHEAEIHARPARTWHQSEWQKQQLRERSREQAQEESRQAQLEAEAGKAQLGPGSVAQRAAALALADDYRAADEDGEGKTGKTGKGSSKDKPHRLSRKKRRRLEALEGAETGDQESRAKKADKKVEVAVKRKRLSAREQEQQSRDRAIGTIGMRKRPVAPVKGLQPASEGGQSEGGQSEGGPRQSEGQTQDGVKKKKKTAAATTVVRRSIAVGGLDQDYVDWGVGLGLGAGAGGAGGGGMTKTQLRRAARDKPFTEFDAGKQLRKGGKVGVKAFKSKAKFKRRK